MTPSKRVGGLGYGLHSGSGALGLIALQTYIYVVGLFSVHPILGTLFALCLGLFSIGVFGFIWREFADLRRISRRSHIREEALRLSKSELHGEAQTLLLELDQHLPAPIMPAPPLSTIAIKPMTI